MKLRARIKIIDFFDNDGLAGYYVRLVYVHEISTVNEHECIC
jgi:hypothetical protein